MHMWWWGNRHIHIKGILSKNHYEIQKPLISISNGNNILK